MKALAYASNFIIPMLFVIIILFGFYKKVALFDSFIEGAKDGVFTVFNIMPTLIGLMVAVAILRASGFFDLLIAPMTIITDKIGFPEEAVPLIFFRLVSSSASTSALLDIFKNDGPDSFIGRFVSVMMSCTETVFYTMSIYFMHVKISKTKYTLSGALFANIVGVIVSLIVTRQVFY